MKTKIRYKDVISFGPCYDPDELGKIDKRKSLTIPEFIEQYRDRVRNKADIIWVICRKDYMSERDMRLFAVWCAREALKLIDPDPRSVNACDVAERFANGEATKEDLSVARAVARAAAMAAGEAAARAVAEAAWAAAAWAAAEAAWAAARARAAARTAAWAAAWAADWDAARAAAEAAARAAAMAAAEAAWAAQIDKLLTFFK